MLLIHTNLQQALLIAEDMRGLIEAAVIDYEDKQIKVKVSIGVASTSSNREKITITDLIIDFDEALYLANNSGRNRVCSVLPP